MIKSLITLLIFPVPVFLSAQFNPENYLGSARSDIRINEVNQKLEYLQENKITSPWLNRVEMRIESQDLNISPEDLRLRINPTNPFEISMNNQYHKIQVGKLYNDMQFNLNLALRTRYGLLVTYLYLKEKIKILEEEAMRLTDEMAVIRGDSEFEPLNVEGIVDMEVKTTDLQIKQTEFKSKLEKSLVSIKLLYEFEGDIQMVLGDLTDVKKMSSLIGEISPEPDTANIYISNAISDLDLRKGKYNVDLGEARRNLGFFQAQYNTDRADPLNDRLGFEIGIRLPITNEDKADLRRSYLDLIEDRFEISRRELWLSEEQQFAFINVMASINKFGIVNSKLSLLFPNDSMEAYSRNADNDPNDLLNIKNNLIKLKDTRLEMLYEVYLNYIEFLDVSGKLPETPLVNYLSPGLNQF